MAAKLPRGVRNHNPGNIRHGGGQWQGLASEQPDKDFCSFTEPLWGLRALARILLNYNAKYGLNTLYGILNRYAPALENDTQSYIAAVARRLGVDQHAKINVAASLPQMMRAIVAHENGGEWAGHYPEALYLEAVRLAFQSGQVDHTGLNGPAGPAGQAGQFGSGSGAA